MAKLFTYADTNASTTPHECNTEPYNGPARLNATEGNHLSCTFLIFLRMFNNISLNRVSINHSVQKTVSDPPLLLLTE